MKITLSQSLRRELGEMCALILFYFLEIHFQSHRMSPPIISYLQIRRNYNGLEHPGSFGKTELVVRAIGTIHCRPFVDKGP